MDPVVVAVTGKDGPFSRFLEVRNDPIDTVHINPYKYNFVTYRGVYNPCIFLENIIDRTIINLILIVLIIS